MTTYLLPQLDVRWLIDPARPNAPDVVPATQELQRVAFPIPPEIGHGWLERLPLAHGVSLFLGVHRFLPAARGARVPLSEFSYVFPEPTVCMHTIQGSAAFHRELYPPAELRFKPGDDFFRRADRFETTVSIDASADSAMTALIISEAMLAELLDPPLAEQLLVRLGLDQPPRVRVLPMPLQVSAPLRAALSAPLQGPLRKLFAQSKVLEYLCALSAHTALSDAQPQVPDRARERVRALHEYLIHLEGELPGLEELAGRFGLSARRLNDAFRREYGMPIGAFIADWRLTEAHAAILTSAVPLKRLAARLGYAHVNNFNAAFRRKFGYPPGSLRRKRRGLDEETGSNGM